jgi:hypothetical protein
MLKTQCAAAALGLLLAERNGVQGKFGVGDEAGGIAEEAKRVQSTPAALCQETYKKIVEQATTTSLEAYAQMRNQIGIMHYCRDKGHITPARAEEVIVFFQSALGQVPPERDAETAASGDAAEKEGTEGKWGPPPRMDIAGMEPLMSAATMCETLSSGFSGKAPQ